MDFFSKTYFLEKKNLLLEKKKEKRLFLILKDHSRKKLLEEDFKIGKPTQEIVAQNKLQLEDFFFFCLYFKRKEREEYAQAKRIRKKEDLIKQRRGVLGEKKIYSFLKKKGLDFKKIQAEELLCALTPDILFFKPLVLFSFEFNWIEVKTDIVDKKSFLFKKTKKQIKKYLRIFGKGILLYYYGTEKNDEVLYPEKEDFCLILSFSTFYNLIVRD